MGEKCFFVDEDLKCPHCKKKIGERALMKADRQFYRDMELKAKEEKKCEKLAESVPVEERLNYAKKIFR